AEGLEVEQDDIGVGGVLPPFQEIVRRHVGLVPDRDERREAEPSLTSLLEQRQPEGTALRGEADAARGKRTRRERRVQAYPTRPDPETVRTDEPCAMGPDDRQQLLLPAATLGACLCETGRDHAERTNAVRERCGGSVVHALAWEADDCE